MIDARRFFLDDAAPLPDEQARCQTCKAFIKRELVHDADVPDILFWETDMCKRCMKRMDRELNSVMHYRTEEPMAEEPPDRLRARCGLMVYYGQTSTWVDDDVRNPFRVTCKNCLKYENIHV